MKKILALAALLALCSCQDPVTPQDDSSEEESTPVSNVPAFAKGADISWVTEMEKKGYSFYNASGTAMECTALMKELGCNAVRYRVWVNPADGWCNKADVLAKARRAEALGLAIMIDFHYSDSWADPSKQTPPAAWKNLSADEMADALAAHTTDVLQTLKDNQVTVSWVQVGNETNTGMCSPTGTVSNSGAGNFVKLFNAGYDAVKAVYPDALVICHHSNAQDSGANKWFYDLVTGDGAKFDMIGLSLYPSYWSNGGYPDWNPYCSKALSCFTYLHSLYNKPVMLVEFGMPVSEPEKAQAALRYLLNGVQAKDWFKGIFYWEPESEKSRNGYEYGAFASGRSTGVLDLFLSY